MENGKYNILMMVSWYGPRAETLRGGSFHYNLAQSLNNYCNCAIYYPYDRYISESFSRSIDWGLLTYRSRYDLKKKVRNRIDMYNAMKKIVDDFHPHLIHANVATECGRFAVILGKIFHIPVIISEHSTIEASGVKEFPHYYYAKFAYAGSKYNTCVSYSLTKGLKEIFPQYAFHTVYNGIKPSEGMELTKGYRKDDGCNVGFVAGLYDDKIKGLQYLFPAIRKIIEEDHQKIYLHLIGGGEYLQYFKKMAEEMGISEYCIFYDRCPREKVYSIISEMDFLVSSSIFESFGCAIAESLLLGVPVVATRCGGPESIVTPENGILVEKESVEALYLGIKDMMTKYAAYDAGRLKQDAYDRFSLERVSQKYMEIYREVLEKDVK